MSRTTIDIRIDAKDEIKLAEDGWISIGGTVRIMTTLTTALALAEVSMMRANALDSAAVIRELAAEKYAKGQA